MFNRKEYIKKWRKKNKKYIKSYNREWLEKNPEYQKNYYINHKEKLLDNGKEFKKKNPEYRENHHKKNREKELLQCRKYYKNNKEKVLEDNKKWKKENPEYQNKYFKKWQKTEKGKANNQRGQTKRRARMRGIINTLTFKEWIEILKKYKFRCIYCGKEFDLFNRPERDHTIPISKGGNNVRENIVPACRSCNARKHNKINKIKVGVI